MRPLSLALALACLVSPFSGAEAQDLVGKSEIEGRAVSLFDDMTWRFDESSADCETVFAGLEFCGKDAGWKTARKPSADFAGFYRLNDRIYGGFIIENVGTEQGLSPEAVRDLILEIPASAPGSEPVVLETQPVSISGQPGETLVYAFAIQGVDVVYANSFVLGPDRILQVMTYEISKNRSDAHREAHAAFLAATRYNAD